MSKKVRWGWDSGGVVVAGRWRHRPGPFPWQQCYPSPSSSPSSSPVDSILLSFIYTSSSRSAFRLAMLASMAASNKSTSSSSLTYSFSSSLYSFYYYSDTFTSYRGFLLYPLRMISSFSEFSGVCCPFSLMCGFFFK